MFRSVFSNWVGLVAMGLASVILTPVLIHGLGDFYYGMWVLVFSLLDYYGLLDVGMRAALFRFVAWSRGTEDKQTAHKVLLSTLAAMIVIGVCLLALTVLLAFVLPGFFHITGAARGVFQWLVLLLGFSLAVTFSARVWGTYLCGLQRFDLYNFAAIVTTALRTGLTIAVLRWGYGAVGVAAVTLGLAVFSLFLHWGLVRRIDPELKLDWKLAQWKHLRELTSYGFYVLLYTAGDYLRSYANTIVTARMLGAALVTPLNVATRLMEYSKGILAAVGGPLMGRMSELDAQANHEELRQLFLRGTRITALLSFFLAALFVLDGKALIRLWVGEGLISSYTLLLILTAGYVVALAQHPCFVVIYARARHQPMALWTLGEAIANVLLSIYWARHYGLVGVALGLTVPMLAVNILIQPWYALRVVGVSARIYLTKSFLRPVLVCGLFVAVCRLVGIRETASATDFFLTVSWQTMLYALLTYATAMTTSERWKLLAGTRQVTGFVVRLVRSA